MADDITQVIKDEWGTDRSEALADRLDEFLQDHVGPGIVEGLYPKTNMEEDHMQQWDDVWQDRHGR